MPCYVLQEGMVQDSNEKDCFGKHDAGGLYSYIFLPIGWAVSKVATGTLYACLKCSDLSQLVCGFLLVFVELGMGLVISLFCSFLSSFRCSTTCGGLMGHWLVGYYFLRSWVGKGRVEHQAFILAVVSNICLSIFQLVLGTMKPI